MRISSRLVAAAFAVCAAVAALTAGSAAAKPFFEDTFHIEDSILHENFCDVQDLTVSQAIVADGTIRAVPHGRAGLAYFLSHARETHIFTNVSNGDAVRLLQHGTEKDQKITDNGDGTLTILVKIVGNDVFYGPDGKAIARNPGQIQFEILVNHNGTPADPFDDEFILGLGDVKGSTGRTDDECAAIVPVLTGA